MNALFKFTQIVAISYVLFMFGSPAVAQGKIVLRAADYIPASHYWIRYGIKSHLSGRF